jgi:hypothetical protein
MHRPRPVQPLVQVSSQHWLNCPPSPRPHRSFRPTLCNNHNRPSKCLPLSFHDSNLIPFICILPNILFNCRRAYLRRSPWILPMGTIVLQSLGTAGQYTACVWTVLRHFRGLARRSLRNLPVYDLRSPRNPPEACYTGGLPTPCSQWMT